MKETLKPRYYESIPEMTSEGSEEPGFRAQELKVSAPEFLRRPYTNTEQVNFRILNTAEGKINSQILVIPSYLFSSEKNSFLNLFIALISSLPSHTRIHLITNNSSEHELNRLIKGISNMAVITCVPDHVKLTPWAEDPFITLMNEAGEKIFLEPAFFVRSDDQLLSWHLEKKDFGNRLKTSLYFEGGNILAGSSFILAGVDYLATSFRLLSKNNLVKHPSEVTELFRSYLGKEKRFIPIGTTFYVPEETRRKVTIDGEEWTEKIHTNNKPGTSQPIFHIDMFITIAGKSKRGKDLLLVGDPSLSEQAGIKARREMMTELFDEISVALSEENFEIVRLPLPLIYIDDPEKKFRRWYFASYNNVLAEITAGSKKVWMPTYGHGCWKELSVLDDMAENIWKDLGFEVTRLPDCNPFAENSGSVHCLCHNYDREFILP